MLYIGIITLHYITLDYMILYYIILDYIICLIFSFLKVSALCAVAGGQRGLGRRRGLRPEPGGADWRPNPPPREGRAVAALSLEPQR